MYKNSWTKFPRNNRQPSSHHPIETLRRIMVTRASQEKFLKKRDSSQSKFQHIFWAVAIWNMVYLLSQTSQTVEVILLSTLDYVKNHSLHVWPKGRHII